MATLRQRTAQPTTGSTSTSHHATIEWVQGSFTVPQVDCKHSEGNEPYETAMWVGVGGLKPVEPTSWLEQAGIFAMCLPDGVEYSPFWEMAPSYKDNASHIETSFTMGGDGSEQPPALQVHVGDRIHVAIYAPDVWQSAASLGAQPGQWTYIVHTPEQNYVEIHRLPGGVNPGHTAEVMTERVDATKSAGKSVGLANFGTVTFSGVSYGYRVGSASGPYQPASVDRNRLDMKHRSVIAIRTSPSQHTAPDQPFTTFSTAYTGRW
jgi:hypothetical protein